MATVVTRGGGPGGPNVGSLSAAQAGNGASTNVVDREGGTGPAGVVLTTAIGATPTCTYAVQGSVDGANWYPVEYADSATPATFVIATFTVTTAGVKTLLLPVDRPWRFLRLLYSANTNVTNTADAYIW